MVLSCTFFETVFVCPQSTYRHNDKLFGIFVYCSRSRVLHVTLSNLQTFRFEFDLRSLPCTFSIQSVNQPVALLCCYTVLTRPSQVVTAVHGCNSWLSVWTLSCSCPVEVSTLSTDTKRQTRNKKNILFHLRVRNNLLHCYRLKTKMIVVLAIRNNSRVKNIRQSWNTKTETYS